MDSKKGISDIITIIILLLVAVSLAGAFFIWAGRSVTTLEESAGKTIETAGSALGQQVSIESASGASLNLRSKGSVVIDSRSLAIFVNGVTAGCGSSWANSTNSAQSWVLIPVNSVVSCTALAPACTSGASIKVTAAGGEATGKCA